VIVKYTSVVIHTLLSRLLMSKKTLTLCAGLLPIVQVALFHLREVDRRGPDYDFEDAVVRSQFVARPGAVTFNNDLH
jgi:hypothetical protein